MNIDKVKITVGIALSLIEAGKEIMEMIQNGDISEAEILEIIEQSDDAKKRARAALIQTLKEKKNQE